MTARKPIDPKALNEWLVLVGGPLLGVAWASWLIITRQTIAPYDITLIVMLVGLRWIGRKP